MNDDEAHLLCW